MLALICALVLPQSSPIAREVEFEGHEGFKLRGELLLPSSEGKHPTVLLLPGSGPTDRNGNQPPALVTDVLKQIAEDFAKNGVATFRFDKRATHVYSKAWPKFESFDVFFSWEPFVMDAVHAFRAMRAQAGVDTARTGMAGHSEGGSIVLAAHSRLSADETPKVTLLLATPGRTMDVVINEQIVRALKVQNVPDSVGQPILENLAQTSKTIAETGKVPADVHPGLKALFPSYIGPYYKGWMAFDPIAAAKAMKSAVLVANGELDIQVSAERDAKPLYQALSQRSGGRQKLVIVAKASHNFKPVQTESEPGFAGPLTPEFLQALRDFVKAEL